MKDEVGIKERINYNLKKSDEKETAAVHVPDEKRRLIIEAFKHFKMITEA